MPKLHRLTRRLEHMPADIWMTIARIDELKGRWDAGARLAPQTLARLRRSVLVTSTGASTRIEGARLSDREIELLMRGINIQKFADRDAQEVASYFELLQNVFESWQSLSLTDGTIRHFHRELLKYVEKDAPHRGNYKTAENKVHMIDAAGRTRGVLFDTVPAWKTPAAMNELVEWARASLRDDSLHPLLTIGNFVVEFLQIHPFQDGNGRLSRVLTNLLMLHAGYVYAPYVSHEKLIEDNKPDYYLALRASQKTFHSTAESVVAWMAFFLKIVLQQSQAAVALLAEAHFEKTLSPKQQAVWRYLQSTPEATPREIAQHTHIPRPTVSQVLTKLLAENKIERIGQGRATRYRAIHAPGTSNLEQ